MNEQEWEIWLNSAYVRGKLEPPIMLATMWAATFAEAVDKLPKNIEDFDRKHMTYQGRRLTGRVRTSRV